jgi:hypothetical protein
MNDIVDLREAYNAWISADGWDNEYTDAFLDAVRKIIADAGLKLDGES